ncbi:M23 family metallopeptidase [Flavobacteriaceae bacterium]|nr:M23 family metallopeptidase [Flavobacteriaceae bacterium]|tara:strand:- start:6589 stop:8283 length:1695 start_codon:yes stop_codon:yes gene_type:complete
MTNNIKSSLGIALLFLSFFISAQEATPPLDIPLLLSGNFGELRGSHFHAGLDIKTQGLQGFPVKSILAGSIRRIRVTVTGYGKALYIDHANGTTSVYAHLQKFAPKIEKIIKERQYKKEQFLIQSYFKTNELTVEQGEIIGYSGNTGGSLGPHLHFEIRDTKTQTPLNPLKLEYDIQDTQRPVISGLYRYDLNYPRQKKKNDIRLIRKNDSTYTSSIQSWSGKTGIGLRMYDRQDLSYNKNGVYKIALRLNGKEMIQYTFDKISFDDGKYINTLIDYKTYTTEGIRIQKLFRDLPYGFSFLPKDAPNGILNFEAGRSYLLQISLEDFHGNKTYVESYIEGNREITTDNKKKLQIAENTVKPELDYLFEFENQEVYLPKNTFFEPVDFKIRATKDTLFVGSKEDALQRTFEIQFKTPEVDSLETNPWCIANLNKKKKLDYVYSVAKDRKRISKGGTPGIYVLSQDTLAPSITPLNFKPKQWLSNYSFLKLKIEDDFSGIKSYRGTINGQWILLEHEPKNNTLTFAFEDIDFDQSQLNFKLEVEDQQGNSSTYETKIFRKAKLVKK